MKSWIMEIQTNDCQALFARFGLREPQKGVQQPDKSMIQSEPAGPFFARFRLWKVQKGDQKGFYITKKRNKSLHQNSFSKRWKTPMDALKGHQASSKISSDTLFWGPQSLLVPTTTTTTTITANQKKSVFLAFPCVPLLFIVYLWSFTLNSSV